MQDDRGLLWAEGPDYDAQLYAIRVLLGRQERAGEELEDRIRAADEAAVRTKGRASERAVDYGVDLRHDAMYQDATHSMAAIGMIAPFIESAFRRLLAFYGKDLRSSDKAARILTLVEETNLGSYFPDHLGTTLPAIFEYRNQMFHNGLEWSAEARDIFKSKVLSSELCSGWFEEAGAGDEAWMYYMSPAFVDHCIETMEQIVRGYTEIHFGLSPGTLLWRSVGRPSVLNSWWRLG